MMVMTAKVDKKKVMLAIAIAVAALAALILLLGAGNAAPTGAFAAASNDQRVQYLQRLGWEVTTTPVESTQVRIPREPSQVYSRYLMLQQSQGFDLSPYAGKSILRYVYQVNNFPGATAPVYATLLVYKNRIIGGDLTDTAPTGRIHPLQPAGETPKESEQ